MLTFLKNFTEKRILGGLEGIVREVNLLEAETQQLSDEELLGKSEELRRRALEEASLDASLPVAFALVREAAKRTLGQRPFDVQLMGGVVLHRGQVAEMMTGEGKTLAAVAPVYLNALRREGVHVVTVNEYLARRDAVWMGQIYHALGLSVACLVPNAAYLYDPSYIRGPRGEDADLAEKKLLYEDLTYRIRGALFTVKKALGLGHKEGVYQTALESEFVKLGINFEKEKIIDVIYDGKKVGTYRPDFVLEGKIILEIKSVPYVGKIEEKQVWSYLKGSSHKLALLANFGGKDIEIKRIVYDTVREVNQYQNAFGPRKSATSPRESASLDRERDTTGSFLVQQEYLRPITRREAYLADVTYGTNHEFGFDYLRDNLAYRLHDQVQRGHAFAIIDEVDSILIDEARTPLIIAAPDAQSSEFYKVFARVAERLKSEEDYAVDEKLKSAAITEAGIEKVEKVIGVKNLYAPENLRLVHYLEESLRAKALFRRDKDYVVKAGEIIIVDEFTGRLLHGRRYSAGLHQAIEAKENVLVKEESRTYAKISIQNYFRMYKKLAGMTGTAQTSAEEFYKVYGLDVVSIPPNRPCVRNDMADVIYKTFDAKMRAVANEVKRRQEAGQPVLLGTTSIEKNELLSAYLTRAGVKHEVLNAKNNEREGAIIAQAGRAKAVTVATNMAGRGVDIILGGNPPSSAESAKVREVGGLHVIGTERHEARRIDNQLRGRSARQGDQGSSQFFLSLEDDLLRIFGSDRIKGLMERFDLPDDQPIEMALVSKAVAQAQAKVEGANFDLRKHLLEYDDVLNKQRNAVYAKRKRILESLNKEELANLILESAVGFLERAVNQMNERGGVFAPENFQELKKAFEESLLVTQTVPWPYGAEPPQDLSEEEFVKSLRDLLTKRSMEISLAPNTTGRMLGILGLLWMNHLESLEALQESIGLRAYGHREPLVEFRREAHRLYQDFWLNFDAWIFTNLFRLTETARTDAERTRTNAEGGLRQSAFSPRESASQKVGRNDPCPCGAKRPDGRPYKYKQCGLINAPHHRK